jgi:hypothetical protein
VKKGATVAPTKFSSTLWLAQYHSEPFSSRRNLGKTNLVAVCRPHRPSLTLVVILLCECTIGCGI